MMESKRTGRDGFAQVLRAEWTTFWKVRGFLIAMVVAALVTILWELVAGRNMTCNGPNGSVCPSVPIGPGGEAVSDKFYFVYQPLTGNGSITVRVTSLSGLITYPPPNHDQLVSGVVPWAKAGIMIKENTRQGSAYAAMMVTGSHGVRMQYNFTQDIAGTPGGVSVQSPRWLRLTRSGDTLTGYESTDGTQWTRGGTAHLAGLPAIVQAGLFVTSPGDLTVNEESSRLSQATATFDHVSLPGNVDAGAWTSTSIGSINGDPALTVGGLNRSGATFTVSGSGDIAPLGAGLTGAIVVAVLFVTSQYPVGRPRVPERPSQKPGHVLVAKALVIGLVTFTTQLVAAAVAVQIGKRIMFSKGVIVLPVDLLTELRVMLGTAATETVAAVFALALGALFRRRVVAMIASIMLTVLPCAPAFARLLPDAWPQWLLRFTPAAGFAIQQSIPQYPQVIGLYTLQLGYYSLAPWAGFAVLCGYTALALGLAVFVPRRRDA